MEYLSVIAGIISSLIFVSSYVPMLLKAYQTKDLHSYSWLNIILVNTGNLIYWFYLVSLPLGPVWILHSFYTISSGLLLVLYWQLYGKRNRPRKARPCEELTIYRFTLCTGQKIQREQEGLEFELNVKNNRAQVI